MTGKVRCAECKRTKYFHDTCPQCGGCKYRYNTELCRRCRGSSLRGRTAAHLLPTAPPTELDIAWIAGFYEGEGSVGYHSSSLRVTLPQNERWCLERVQRFFGGSIRPQGQGSCLVLSMSGELAARFVLRIYPYLSPRRKAQMDRAWNARAVDRGEAVHSDSGADQLLAG